MLPHASLSEACVVCCLNLLISAVETPISFANLIARGCAKTRKYRVARSHSLPSLHACTPSVSHSMRTLLHARVSLLFYTHKHTLSTHSLTINVRSRALVVSHACENVYSWRRVCAVGCVVIAVAVVVVVVVVERRWASTDAGALKSLLVFTCSSVQTHLGAHCACGFLCLCADGHRSLRGPERRYFSVLACVRVCVNMHKRVLISVCVS